MTEETETLSVTTVVYPPDCEEASIRQIGFGLQPLILLEPEVGDDDEFGFKLTASLIDLDEVADMLELIVRALREGS